jgi:hypothetical protein
MEPLFDEKEYCSFARISRSKAAQDRMNGVGPKFLKLGRSVRYRLEDVEAYLDKQSRQNTINKIGSM